MIKLLYFMIFFGSWGFPFLLFPSFWYRVILAVQRNLFQNLAGFVAKSNLAFLFSSVTSGLRLEENPLYLHLWRLILSVGNDASTSFRVFLASLDVVKSFFFHQGKNSVIIHFSCLLWSPRSFGVAKLLHSFFLRRYQIFYLATSKVSVISLIHLLCFFLTKYGPYLFWHLLERKLRALINSWKMQIKHFNSRHFISLICNKNNEETSQNWPWNSQLPN